PELRSQTSPLLFGTLRITVLDNSNAGTRSSDFTNLGDGLGPHLSAKDLSSLEKSPLIIGSGVHEVRIVQCKLTGPVDDVVNCFNSKHEAMIRIACFVTPRAESPPRVNALVLQCWQ